MSAVAPVVAPLPTVAAGREARPRRAAATAGRWAARGLSLAACLLLWHWASTTHLNLGVITFANLPPPVEVAQAGWDLLQSPKLLHHLGYSLWRIAAGFAAAALLGIGLGLLIGRFRWAQSTLLPPLEVLRPIPAVAWIPLAILMFPSSEVSMIFITFTGALFPILLNTVHGVEAVDPRLIASARSLGTRGWQVFSQVVLPAAAPSIATGLAIGMGTCWFCLVSAEMISGQFGIGYYTWESYTLQNYAGIIVGMLWIGLFGMGSSALIRLVAQALMPWYAANRRSA
ncbi:ABC transporter permease [Caldimonas brevitalea]|uniref:ABC transporter permease n=1 Tax=Caldimonas brevitalea TaxID=413882 RepID=A0A0G3BXP2_9BURK|nr:ABC transporter permease [Caldimonas brevitalea]AKJ31260.1 ABC transporter permease [Caldimonas brevitalea]